MTAFVDESGKIHGVNEYTLPWFHERGHIEYQNSEKGMKNSYTAQSLFKILIAFMVLALYSNLFKLFALATFLGWLGFGIYEELWCWNYAYKMKRAMDGKRK
ncbi:MAG: hypothetical protein ACOC56_05360 [Atribacterota bacterium]